MRRVIASAMTAILLSSCVSVPKDAGFSDLAELTAPMLSAPAEWVGETISEQAASDRISALLSEPLTEASVAEITVLANRDLRAVLYGLKAARGEYVDDASLPNPFVTAMFIDDPGSTSEDCFGNLTRLDIPMGGSLGVGYEILDLLFFPKTIKAAKADFNAAKYGSIRQFADYTYKSRLQFYEAMAAKQMLGLAEQSHKAMEASAGAAQALYDAGNIPLLDLNRERLFAAQMKAQHIMAQRRFNMAERRLVQALGLPPEKAASIKLEGRLRTPDKDELAPLPVQSLMDRNLELKHREALIRAAGARMGLQDVMSFVGDVEIEGEVERHDGEYEYSGGIGFELPIFNFGQGRREANRARMEMMAQGYEASMYSLDSSAGMLYDELAAAREGVLLQRREVLPLSNKVLQGMQLDYNAMQIGVFDLLAAKREQLAVGIAYIEAVEDYWKTRAAYEYMLAGGSPEITGPASSKMSGTSKNAGGDH